MRVLISNYGERRREMVEIDKWDTWNMDQTLALIIVPMLRQLQETTHGAPYVDLEDVPEDLRVVDKKDEWDTDSQHFDRWDWVLAEMTWGFEQIVADSHKDILNKAYHARIDNATRLFGKYYRGLWD